MINSAELDKYSDCVREGLADIKAYDIVEIDTTAKTPLFARIVIASADNARQLRALSIHIPKLLKEQLDVRARVSGVEGGEWVIVDTGRLVVHIMLPAARQRYALEELWGA